MTVVLDSDTISLINFFENLTGVTVKDCVVDKETNTVYFIVEEGKIGLAIGKGGSNVKHAEKILRKKIKLVEFSQDVCKFVKNLIPKASDVVIKTNCEKKIVEIKVEKNDKPSVIGRDKKRLKIMEEILRRNYKLDQLVVK
jgi:N utilization substance protein A